MAFSAQKDLFAAALIHSTDNSVWFSSEKARTSQGQLFSASEVEESDNGEEKHKDKERKTYMRF